MCGRTVCSLAPKKLCNACRLAKENGELVKPQWKSASDGHEYVPSYNFCPQNYGPVLLSGQQFEEGYKANDVVFQPMKWGLVPSWSKDMNAYKIINARSDSLLEKTTFKTPLSKGLRCVVVVDGFYEWEKEKYASKQPYFIHMPQSKDINWDKSDENDDTDSDAAWNGRRLMYLAGIFDVNKHLTEEPLYSYTIITVDSSKRLSFMHDRMPAILSSDKAVLDWLDAENVSLNEALKLLKPLEEVDYFKVSKKVGTVSYKESDCVAPFIEEKKQVTKVQGTLLQHFQVIPKKSPSKVVTKLEQRNGGDDVPKKKIKRCQKGEEKQEDEDT